MDNEAMHELKMFTLNMLMQAKKHRDICTMGSVLYFFYDGKVRAYTRVLEQIERMTK